MPLRPSALLAALLELAAPTRCAGCELPGSLVCDACLAAIPRIDAAHACLRCGAPSSRGVTAALADAGCPECAGRTYAFSAARAYGSLAHPLSRLVSVHKDGGEERLAGPLAGMLAEAAAEWLSWADAFVPLPASPAGQRRRGRDHMRDVAAELEALPVVATASASARSAPLLARAGGGDQRAYGRADRERNLDGALRLTVPSSEVPRRVLLLDDVFTTGSTAHAAAGLLLAHGASEVRFVALARAHAGSHA